MTERCVQVKPALSSRDFQPSASTVRHFPVQLATAQVSNPPTDLAHSSAVASSQPSTFLDGIQTAQGTQSTTAEVFGAAHEHASSTPAHASPTSQHGHEDDLEEGELAAAAIPESSTADGLSQGQQQQAVGGAETHPATTGKRKRGERAGKRVRHRQAKQAREAEAKQQFQDGLQQTAYAPKMVPSPKKVRPVCKYFLFGKCSKGESCPFPHTGMPGEACQYSHDATVDPCKQLLLHGNCQRGAVCLYSHDPLPQYAVAPLKDWFAEQDQLKLDRAARRDQETQPAVDCSFTEAHQNDIDADGLDEVSCIDNGGDGVGTQTSPAAAHSAAKVLAHATNVQHTPQQPGHQFLSSPMPAEMGQYERYKSWTSPWEKMYGERLKTATHQTDFAASKFEPLESSYTSWQDGWNRLFAKQKEQTPQ
ncbi:MAG: hypothetical protein FRX49_02551 [Trebouxia sp. A1-2]|nr:MAG: hypothetical protein FRX49_02551 [Trebouxia sp. A1-2]